MHKVIQQAVAKAQGTLAIPLLQPTTVVINVVTALVIVIVGLRTFLYTWVIPWMICVIAHFLPLCRHRISARMEDKALSPMSMGVEVVADGIAVKTGILTGDTLVVEVPLCGVVEGVEWMI